MSRKGVFYARKLAWMMGRTRFQTAAGPLRVPRSKVSPAIFYHLVTFDYEVPELQMLERFLQPSDSVIELGAGIGFLANIYGRRAAQPRHLAVEASPDMCDLIRTNVAGLANVEVLNAIAGAPLPSGASLPAPRSRPFYIYDDFWASSTEPLHLGDPARRLRQTVEVSVVDLDRLIAERGCTMLICDIEGGEYDLLSACALNVPKILIELHWQALGVPRAIETLTMLQARGYTLHGSPDVLMAVRER